MNFKGGWSATIALVRTVTGSGIVPCQLNATMNGGNIGTYGVLSVGVAGQVVNTGWLGDAQFDYENGADIRGWAASGGIRYPLTPEVPRTAMSPRRPPRPLQEVRLSQTRRLCPVILSAAGLRPFSPDIPEIGRAGPNTSTSMSATGNTLNSRLATCFRSVTNSICSAQADVTGAGGLNSPRC